MDHYSMNLAIDEKKLEVITQKIGKPIKECIGISYARGASVDSLDQFDGLMVAVGLSFEDTEIILMLHQKGYLIFMNCY